MKKQFFEIGKIVSVHGIKGEMKINPWSDSPEFLLSFKEFYLDNEGKASLKVKSLKPHKNIVILKVDGIDDIDTANKYRNKILYINRKDAKLPKGTYFIQELIGLKVIDHDDSSIEYGEIVDVSPTGANDVYHIKKDDKEYLIPAIKQVVIKTDIDEGIMTIKPLEGLFDDED